MLDINSLEELGLIDYYLDLSKFIRNFINRNYPLTTDDFRALTNDMDTENTILRKKLTNIMKSELLNILNNQAVINKKFLSDLENNINVKAISQEEYNKQIFDYKQRILEELYNYTSNYKNKSR